jgi:hypothetical protein
MDIQYGVKITTTQGTLTDYGLGCVNGVIGWGTGRADVGEFKLGVILKNSFSEVSQEIEISAGGSYATMSGFSLEADNSDGLADRIRDLGLNLIQADAIFYTFRDGVATQDWTGKVADWSYDENRVRILFMDSFRGIHKPFLTQLFNATNFPNAPADTLKERIPVVIGMVKHCPLVNVNSAGSATDLTVISSVARSVCAAKVYNATNRTLDLFTRGVVFGVDSPLLTGRYVRRIAGGADQSIRILSNLATNVGAETTQITLAQPFDDAPVVWTSTAQTGIDVSYFQVYEYSSVFVASAKAISEYSDTENGNARLQAYDEGFFDIGETYLDEDLEDIDETGFPGVLVISRGLDGDGDVSVFFPIVPESIDLFALDNFTLTAGSIPEMMDRDAATHAEYTSNIPSGSDSVSIAWDVKLPVDALERDFDNLYLLLDFKYIALGSNLIASDIVVFAEAMDIYSRKTQKIITNQTVGTVSSYLVEKDVFLLPSEHYRSTAPSPDLFFSEREDFQVGTLVSDIKKSIAYNAFRLTVSSSTSEFDDFRWRFREIAFLGKKSINFSDDTLYTALIGEVFQTDWTSGRRDAADPILNIADALEHLIRNYDEAQAAIDVDSFDMLSDPSTGIRKNWYVGRRLDGSESSYDLIQELCRYGFFGVVPRNNGTRAPKAWMDGAVVATHSDTNGTINTGTIGEKKPTSLANLFNEPQVNYGWNPGSGKYDAFLHITNIDQAEFPIESDPAWKTYAVGYEDADYDEAKDNWDLCRLSWTKYGIIQKLPDDMANAKWFPNVESDWGLASTYNAAKAYMRELCRWTPFRKDVVPYELPNTAVHASLELLDRITFSDSTDRGGAEVDGWIVRKAVVPGLDRDYIEIHLMLEPDIE